MVPSGAQGKQLVSELACVFNVFASESALEAFAINAVMTVPALLLQKPTAKSSPLIKSARELPCGSTYQSSLSNPKTTARSYITQG